MSASGAEPRPDASGAGRPRPGRAVPSIPGYRIEEVLGRGSSGVVFRARQLAVERDVALKVLHPELCAKKRVVQRLQREARTSARLAHPNLVSAIDLGEADGLWWFAMELVDGPSLAERLRTEGRLSEREALRLFLPLCEALEHLWQNGVVHRDVKPANVLLDGKGGARLADFGLALGEDDPSVTQAGGTLGTPHYVSPEQAVDPKTADVRSDLWSFGATLYHALCGRPPFAGDSTAEILSAVLYERVPDPLELAPELSKGIVLVLRKCLVRDRAARYTTPRELRLDLELVRERRAPRVSRSRLDPLRRERDPRRAWGVAALALAAGLLGWAWLASGSGAAGADGDARLDLPAVDPLEALAARRRAGEPAAALLEELELQRPALSAALRAQADALAALLGADVAAEVATLVHERQIELRERLAQGDFAGARALVADAPPHPLGASGLARAGLERWRVEARARIAERERETLSAMEGRLVRWRRERLARADALAEEGRWAEARALLDPPREELRAAAGELEARFAAPDAAAAEGSGPLSELLAREELALRLRRQRLDDDWARLDAGLRRAVLAEAALLREELERAGLAAGEQDWSGRLRSAFARELGERGQSAERFPRGLANTALATLEERSRELDEAARERVAAALSAEVEEAEGLARGLARRREYVAAAELWDETLALVVPEPGAGGDETRQSLARRARLRREEARLLAELAESVRAALRALDGRESDLRLGNIVYPGARVKVEEPLEVHGFELAGHPGRFYVQTLPSRTFEELAGLGPLERTSSIGRVQLACFRFAEGDPGGAHEALSAGPAAQSEPWRSLALELEARLAVELGRAREAALERDAEAERLLAIVFDEERASETPRSVLARVERLLGDYREVPAVGRERERLLALRERLRGGLRSGDAASFRAVYDPTALAFTSGERVQLAFDFAERSVGAWEPGEWVSDGTAWRLAEPVRSFEGLLEQRGPSLVLRAPLDPDGGLLEARLGLEGPLGNEPRLLVVSCAGFHVALVGPALPGNDREPRWLADSGSLEGLLARVRAGEGERAGELLRRGAAHELALRVQRRSGRIEVLLDDRSLGSARLAPPAGEPVVLTLRSWEPLRLLRVVVEGER